MHDFTELFSRFWWLIFPLYWMVIHTIRASRRTSSQDRAMEILRIYAAKGEQPPPDVLKALTQMSNTPDDLGMGTGNGGLYSSPSARGTAVGSWWTFFVFLALTAGFAAGINGIGADDGQARSAFMIVTVIMAFLAVGSLIMALFASFRGRQ
ncbi:MAG: hypothetical protein QM759_01010 [Terricaulis sp.]